MRVLLVEDEQNVASFLKKGLEEEFYTVDVAEAGGDGLAMATSKEYDCIILDVMLPEMSGIEICKKLRSANVKTPILMLTALDSIGSKVEGLESGADDYLTKPFAFSELLARIRALLRRAPDSLSELTLNDLRMDLLSRRVFRGDQEIVLTQKGFAILEYFLRNKGRVLSRTQIIENIWGYNFDPNTNVVDVHIKFLREKIDKDFKTKLIHTVRGSGYVLKAEDDNQDLQA
ncbi:DNA-binding response regulator in two-component regulatory system with CusS [Candidatus Sulfobium mesophilum]|uniref:DNA-binding response regulator in two-component regulatory system with CusS n=1 Tax=Candidatus Sulfobium mesophilum TaxID=2016548 RepID=A0A2U3QIG6_9BACT|nr:DNA-binding response regulator in two-component regulatory system with CusS [Candidatus Sulfobium mesophilum]